MARVEVPAGFPKLVFGRYTIESKKTDAYNCIAYAADDMKHWWWPPPNFRKNQYWPTGASDTVELSSFREAFQTLGYSVCSHGELEPGTEKVALFIARNAKPSHAARQLETGIWCSKLGDMWDIDHHDIDGVGGHDRWGYGDVAEYMSRPKIPALLAR